MRTIKQMLTPKQWRAAQRRKAQYLELHRFQSESNPEKGYRVNVHRDTHKLSCTCPGWVYNRKCWHTRQIAEATGLEVER